MLVALFTYRHSRLHYINMMLDRMIVLFSVVGAYWSMELTARLGASYEPMSLFGLDRVSIIFLAIILIFFYPSLLKINGLYPSSRIRTLGGTTLIIGKSVSFLIIGIILVIFLAGKPMYDRASFIIFGVLLFILTLLKEVILKHVLERGKLAEYKKKTIIVTGDVPALSGILKDIEKDKLNLIIGGAVIAGEEQDMPGQIADVPVLGAHKNIEKIIRNIGAELVVAVFSGGNENYLDEILDICETMGVEVWFNHPIFGSNIKKLEYGYIGEVPMLRVSMIQAYGWQMLAKDIFDKLFAMLLFPFFCVLYIVVGIAIKLSSPGPVLFKQKRGGLYGRPFTFYKFRTMEKDAEKKLGALAASNEMKGPVHKMKNDPRVFLLGRILRKTSIDEVPQLINILKGDMSFVGPRPSNMRATTICERWQRRRLSMKPGLTCIWQVSGRNLIKDFNDWVKMDLEYIDNWSLWLDIKILFKTIWVVLTCYGAE